MLDNADVLTEGFQPLQKKGTEPQLLSSKPQMTRGMSLEFNAETGEKESSQTLWEGSSWEKLGRSRGKTMDRANSFIGSRSVLQDIPEETETIGVVVIVDPFSTGAHLAAEVCKNGLKCARVLSTWDSPVAALVQKGLNIDFCATVQHNDRATDQESSIVEVIIFDT